MLVDTNKVFEEKEQVKEVLNDTILPNAPVIEILGDVVIHRQLFINIKKLRSTKEKSKYNIELFLRMGDNIKNLGLYEKEDLRMVGLLCKDFENSGINLINFEAYNDNNILPLKGLFDT